MLYVGIDVGKNGGIAILFEDCQPAVYPYSDDGFVEIMEDIKDEDVRICVEEVHAMPKQGVVSMFKFGKSAGFIEGVLKAFKIPYQLIRPQIWKKEFNLNSDKQASIDVCKKLYPKANLLATPRCRKEHDGMAEALLMATYAKRKF